MEQKKLGFGFMRLPLKDKNDQASINMELVCKMVDTFLKRGFSYFDTAYMYHNGQSQVAVREAVVKRYPRNSFTVATKMPISMLQSKEQQNEIFEDQMQKCGVDYFDYYLLHDINRKTYPVAERMDSFAFIAEQKKTGRIRNIGFSFHDSADMLEKFLTEHPEVDFVQLQLNYLDWDNASIQSGKCYDVATKHGKKIIVMEPVKGGTLANVPEKAEELLKAYHPELSVASWAIRFAASLENVMMVLSGMSNMEQLNDNTGYMQEFKSFTQEEYDIVRQTVSIINESVSIPCTACRYCVAGCPNSIAIPEYFALYNAEQRDINKGYFTSQLDYFSSLIETYGKPSDCTECKECENICPQHLRVSDELKSVADVLETGLARMMEMMK